MYFGDLCDSFFTLAIRGESLFPAVRKPQNAASGQCLHALDQGPEYAALWKTLPADPLSLTILRTLPSVNLCCGCGSLLRCYDLLILSARSESRKLLSFRGLRRCEKKSTPQAPHFQG
jgi:hypothetical protein